jgi:hypothetical protein
MIYLDIETLDFFQDEHIKALPRTEQLKAIRFGCAVTYCADTDCWKEWAASETLDLWRYLSTHAPVVGWNIADFDLPIIYHQSGWAVWDTTQPATIDLFAEIRRTTGRWYKLEDVCQWKLGRGKLANGQKAAEWLRSGDSALVRKAFEYCRYDVELTVSLHSRLLSGEPLRLLPRPVRQELNELRWTLDGCERLPDESGAVSIR